MPAARDRVTAIVLIVWGFFLVIAFALGYGRCCQGIRLLRLGKPEARMIIIRLRANARFIFKKMQPLKQRLHPSCYCKLFFLRCIYDLNQFTC